MARILIVDDEPDVRENLSSILSKEGYEVRAASDGSQGLVMVEGYKPDLILLDVKMPNLDGLEVCRRIRNTNRVKGIPIIMITGYPEEKQVALNVGADDFLNKPFDKLDVLTRIRCILKIGQLNDELQRTKAYLEELKKAGKI